MSWRIEWEVSAEETLKRLPTWRAAARVCKGMMDFAATGAGDVRRMGYGDEYRLYVGSYVVRFSADRADRTLRVWTVFRRD